MARETPALRRQDGPFFATSACYDASPDMYALSLHAAGRKACAHQTTFDSCVSTFAAAPRPMGIIWRKPLLAIVLLTQGAHGPPRLQKTSSCYQSPNPKTQAPSPVCWCCHLEHEVVHIGSDHHPSCRAPVSFARLISVSTGVAFAVGAAASQLFSAAAQLR